MLGIEHSTVSRQPLTFFCIIEIHQKRKGELTVDETRLKDELMARLSNTLERQVLEVIDGALSTVLRDYEVSKKETGLSTEVVTWPEYDLSLIHI